MATHRYLVPTMTCQHCQASIETEVNKVAGVASVRVDLDTKTVTVDGGDDTDVRAAIDEAGFALA